MWPNSMTMKAYAEAKTETPKALSDANALFAKASAVSTSREFWTTPAGTAFACNSSIASSAECSRVQTVRLASSSSSFRLRSRS